MTASNESATVKKQLDNMVSFIKKEAEEKANEIAVKAEEEFTLERGRLVQAQKLKIMKDFERREKQVEVQKKIAYSNELNKSRLMVLKAREDGIQLLFNEAKHKLVAISKNETEYRPLLKKLILQGLYKLGETSVELRLRSEDNALASSLLDEIKKEYNTKTGKEVKISFSDTNPLPSGPSAKDLDDDEAHYCTGGVILSCRDGKIVINNTLDARLELAYGASLPAIRKILFSSIQSTKGKGLGLI
eukprot:TRINITY_DN415_c0_g1_i2.p1 TRINITY_DN415_c0_g1~~TRINITY_DN415_c0_g1_i2.p1  ORF type:complete len:246 (+),score=60.48 TRINITY_DN415_c0_g1_i2:58-795(+)